MGDITKLTPAQQRAFNKLKAAYKDCGKSGIIFININDCLNAYDSDLVQTSTDIKSEGNVFCADANTKNSIKIEGAWIDCDPFLVLTDKGKKLNEEE